MKKLPSIEPSLPASPPARCLAQWLREWRVELSLREEPDSPVASLPGAALLDGPALAAGQIRLLYPAAGDSPPRLCYLALLREAGPGRWLVAPFGRFSVPATPGEWRSPRSEPPLRVLCLWNARVLDAGSLLRSWLIDTLAESEQTAACAVQDGLRSGRPLPPGLSDMTGPPIHHPLDLRHDYMDEERAWMEAMVGAFFRASRPLEFFPEPEVEQLPLAAEPKKKYRAPAAGKNRKRPK